MDSVEKNFDRWAHNGRAELMEREHGRPVKKFLEKADFGKSFTFLDIGCGNGWVVRAVASFNNCKKATGIDKSKKMIKNAAQKRNSTKEDYITADIEEWNTAKRFDRIFSMETIYYTKSPQKALKNIFKLLKPGGMFFCGTDFYAENKATANWSEKMNLNMHLLSKKQWKSLFEDTRFETKTMMIKDKTDRKKWKQELGTLFIIGTKPSR